MTSRHRFFFAVRPPEPVAYRAGLVRDAFNEKSGGVRDDRLHVTLGITKDFEERPAQIVDRLRAIGSAIDAEPCMVSFDRVSGSGSSIALRPSRALPGLAALNRQVDHLLLYWNMRRPGWTFHPHMTLLYCPHAAFLWPIEPVSWEATELVLIHSLLGRTRHIVLGRWPLVRRQMELLRV